MFAPLLSFDNRGVFLFLFLFLLDVGHAKKNVGSVFNVRTSEPCLRDMRKCLHIETRLFWAKCLACHAEPNLSYFFRLFFLSHFLAPALYSSFLAGFRFSPNLPRSAGGVLSGLSPIWLWRICNLPSLARA